MALPPAAPIHFSIPPNWLLNLLSEIGLPVPSMLTNWPPFHPHFPWCLCRIPPQAPVFPAPSLSPLPAHHGPLSFLPPPSPLLAPVPTGVQQYAHLLSVSVSVHHFVSPLFLPISLSLISLSRCVSSSLMVLHIIHMPKTPTLHQHQSIYNS